MQRNKESDHDKMAREMAAFLAPFLVAPRALYVAVSGGSDSMALFELIRHALHSIGDVGVSDGEHALTILHMNHGLRGEESDRDQALVRAWAEEKYVPLIVKHVDVRAEQGRGESVESAARRLRYAFFAEAMAESMGKEEKPLLFLAHHADDQVESILMHLLRGSGMTGLGGMQAVESRDGYLLLRPLLGYSKEMLKAWCRAEKIPWREDASNQDKIYTRNRIRLDVLPLLRKVNPSVDEALLRTAEILREEDRYIEERTDVVAQNVFVDGRKMRRGETQTGIEDPFERNARVLGSFSLRKEPFLQASTAIQRRLLRRWLEEGAGQVPTYADVERMRARFLQSSGVETEEYGIMFLTDSMGVHLLPPETNLWWKTVHFVPLTLDRDALLAQPISTPIGTFSFEFHAKANEEDLLRCKQAPGQGRDVAAFDATSLSRLTFEVPRGGEKFTGFGGGTKPLRRRMTEWHVLPFLRSIWPVLRDETMILWVPGCARSAGRPVRVGHPMVRVTWRLR